MPSAAVNSQFSSKMGVEPFPVVAEIRMETKCDPSRLSSHFSLLIRFCNPTTHVEFSDLGKKRLAVKLCDVSVRVFRGRPF